MPDRARRHHGGSPDHVRAPADGEPLHDGLGLLTPQNALALQRAAGNRAVTGALRAGGVPVQRWAWIGRRQINPSSPALDNESDTVKAWAADKRAREYVDLRELRAHAAGETEHIGHLPDALPTWVRFPARKTSVLGEQHRNVTLDQVVKAVGTTSFRYEGFANDKMPDEWKSLKAAVESSHREKAEQFGVSTTSDHWTFGAESLFPKLGECLTHLEHDIDRPDSLGRNTWGGKMFLQALKRAWSHCEDLLPQAAWKTSADRELARTVARTKFTIIPFLREVDLAPSLGDALETDTGRAARGHLKAFCAAFTKALVARTDADTVLTEKERARLRGMKGPDYRTKFRAWRDMHFAHTVKEAVKANIRYVGMGNEHLKVLVQAGLPSGAKAFDMDGDDLARFRSRTSELLGDSDYV
jgi:hypothetical protein